MMDSMVLGTDNMVGKLYKLESWEVRILWKQFNKKSW